MSSLPASISTTRIYNINRNTTDSIRSHFFISTTRRMELDITIPNPKRAARSSLRKATYRETMMVNPTAVRVKLQRIAVSPKILSSSVRIILLRGRTSNSLTFTQVLKFCPIAKPNKSTTSTINLFPRVKTSSPRSTSTKALRN